jgi:Fic family protein
LDRALNTTDKSLQKVLAKTKFWDTHANTPLNERQRIMVNKLFDGFFGKLSTSKWAKMAKCSNDTALRDIQDLLKKNILVKEEGGGRSTGYMLSTV